MSANGANRGLVCPSKATRQGGRRVVEDVEGHGHVTWLKRQVESVDLLELARRADREVPVLAQAGDAAGQPAGQPRRRAEDLHGRARPR